MLSPHRKLRIIVGGMVGQYPYGGVAWDYFHYCLALHELGHWTMPKHRCDREVVGRYGTKGYAAEELVAELNAAFLCAHLGIKGELRHADWVIAHGTYLDPSEFWQLRPEAAPGDQRVAIAFCPRTHARFGHAPHPYRAMLAQGVVVCLGTDSLASSPTLSLLDEIRFLHRRDPSLGGPLLLTMATLFGAWALRAEAIAGSLKAGKSADLAIVALPDREEEDPFSLMLESDLPVIGTVFEGDFVSGRWVGA